MTRFPLSLHHLNAPVMALDAFVARAGELGCDHVSVFVNASRQGRGHYPIVTQADVPSLRDALRQAGVTLCNLEVFPLDGEEDWTTFERALDLGASLGGSRATATLQAIGNEAEGADRLARFCRLAAQYGVTVSLEAHAFSAVSDFAAAAAIVRAAGEPNAQLVCDTLHLVRNGATLEQVRAAADIIGYMQINDGLLHRPREEWWDEAIGDRGIPGTGEFPLSDILAALRPGTVVEIEAPKAALSGDPRALDSRLEALVSATRQILDGTAALQD